MKDKEENPQLRKPTDHGMEKIGLIAGNGQFPIAFARAAKEKGMQVIAVAHWNLRR